MKYLNTIALLLMAFTLTAQSRQEKGRITVDSTNRTFITYVPAVDNAPQKLPVVIALHLGEGTGEQMMSLADFRPLADREKFIVVYPNGLDHSWNDGRIAREKNDVKFIAELIKYIVNTYNGDSLRVYATGISNGGFMATRLACELNTKIAAIAVVAATMGKDVPYHPDKPMPAMYIHGTKDPLVPYNGGLNLRAAAMVYSHEEMLKFWATADNCNQTPVITAIPDSANDGTSVIKEEYINAQTGLKVVGYTITNGGHTWPGTTKFVPRLIFGRVTHNLNACQVIWDFFKNYKLPG